jgi:hypothetical protein
MIQSLRITNQLNTLTKAKIPWKNISHPDSGALL